MRYRLVIAYRGAGYAGWQRQTNAVGVQQRVEEALAEVLGATVAIHGAGRTDAGVHAAGQVAHFSCAKPVSTGALVHGVNRFLPEDVRVLRADEVAAGFHARKSATAKEYRYRGTRAEVLSPLVAPFSIRVEPTIDVAEMRRAIRGLPGRHDFTAFATSGGAHRDPRRTVFAAEWEERGDDLELRVVGDGFLRGMVRALAGTLLEVGRHRRSVDEFLRLLSGAPRSAAGPNAPPQGLTLVRVFYPPDLAVPSGADAQPFDRDGEQLW